MSNPLYALGIGVGTHNSRGEWLEAESGRGEQQAGAGEDDGRGFHGGSCSEWSLVLGGNGRL